MAPLPEPKPDSLTVEMIYEAYQRAARSEKRRGYLGASQIGGPCERALWYGFRWCGEGESFDGRMLRLFATGDLEEERFGADLRSIGCEVHLVDPDTGKQFAVSAVAGHFRGHMDGAALGVPEAPKTWHLLEFKTHNAKSFATLRAQSVAKAKPEHYAQMAVYMALGGLKRALYLAVNKDTDELYSERLRWEEVRPDAEALLARAERVVKAKFPPARLSDDRDHFQCRWCSYRELCHESTPPAPAVPLKVTCRSCVHATPEMDGDGRWSCAKKGKTLAVAEQERACPDHLFIPDLIAFAECVDAGYSPDGDWTEYQNQDGTTWRNGRQEGHYTSEELAMLPGPLVGAGMVDAAKRELGAVVESSVPVTVGGRPCS